MKPGRRKGGKIPLCDGSSIPSSPYSWPLAGRQATEEEEAKKDSIAGKISRHLLHTILSIVCRPPRVLGGGGGGGLPSPDAALIVEIEDGLNNSLQTTDYDYGIRNLIANNRLFILCDWYINLDHLYWAHKIQ